MEWEILLSREEKGARQAYITYAHHGPNDSAWSHPPLVLNLQPITLTPEDHSVANLSRVEPPQSCNWAKSEASNPFLTKERKLCFNAELLAFALYLEGELEQKEFFPFFPIQ